MRFSGGRKLARTLLGLWLLHQLAPASAAAESTHGVLTVSMTVLASCEVRTNDDLSLDAARVPDQGLANAAMVTCAVVYPFRASLARGSATGFVESGGDAGLVCTGTCSVELSQLAGDAKNRGFVDEIRTLTISY